MNAYFGIKYHPDHRNRSKIERVSAILESCGYSVVCVTRDIEKWGQISFSPAELMKETFNVIEASDVVIIDLSEKGVGLGIEAGYAFSIRKPIITISEKQEISTTLRGISNKCFVYDQEDDLFEFFDDALGNRR